MFLIRSVTVESTGGSSLSSAAVASSQTAINSVRTRNTSASASVRNGGSGCPEARSRKSSGRSGLDAQVGRAFCGFPDLLDHPVAVGLVHHPLHSLEDVGFVGGDRESCRVATKLFVLG
jgi:hypothetical protein